jgi:hypothetical protein
MIASLEENERRLADSIQRYGFAATIEVANALICPAEKVGQSMTSKSYLEQLAGGRARVSAGLAYYGSLVDPKNMDCLDFIIDINRYDPERLEGVAYEMIDGRYTSRGGALKQNHASLIRRMLDTYDLELPLAAFLAHSCIGRCAKRIQEDPAEYRKKLAIIKGLCMELYIKSLFSEEIGDRVIYHQHKYGYRESRKSNIVVCREGDFYAALERISKDDRFNTWVKRWARL